MQGVYDPSIDGPLQEIVVPSELAAAKRPEQYILEEVQRCGYTDEAVFGIKLSLEEAMTNAVRHGNRSDKNKRVTVRYAVTPRRTVIMIADEGPGSLFDALPDPTRPENLERPNGRGVMLMRAYMTRVEFNGRGNEVLMIKENERWQPQTGSNPTDR